MAVTAPLKKTPSIKKWMAQADPSKEANTVKKMNDPSLYSTLQIKRNTALKNGRLQVMFWKKYFAFTNIWCFK